MNQRSACGEFFVISFVSKSTKEHLDAVKNGTAGTCDHLIK